MDLLHTLGVALGLATLAGLNLYLTVFVTGLAIHFGWVVLPAPLHELSALGDPWVIGVAGLLYFLEFFADKVPWIDSMNDTVHTFIRPLGGALLAALALGDAQPAVKVIAAVLAGGLALTAHTAKAGTRLVANTSPEPISNIGLSVGEDAVVLGGLGLLAWHPVVAAAILLLLAIAVWSFLPRLLRSIHAISWLAWRKLNGPPSGQEASGILMKLPGACELALRRAHATTEPLVLAIPCLSGGGPRLPRNLFGWLVQFEGGRLFFVAPRWRGSMVLEVGRLSVPPQRESRFLGEKLLIELPEGGRYQFIFERGYRAVADAAGERLKETVEPVVTSEVAVAA